MVAATAACCLSCWCCAIAAAQSRRHLRRVARAPAHLAAVAQARGSYCGAAAAGEADDEDAQLEDGIIEAREMVFAPKPEKKKK